MPNPPTVGVRDCDPPPYVPSPLAHQGHPRTPSGLVGRSSSIHRLREDIRRYAPTSATVLILGETGVGKELVARALHEQSLRSKRPFVAANVASFTPSMLMSELFGHERGAFTGAYLRHKGLFEQAHGGTLFLDEIGELDPEAQAALLRVLETREVRAIGAEHHRHVDVRLIAATHRDLRQMVRVGAFRDDLYYRVNLLVVEVPALRYRVSDVVPLAAHTLSLLAAEHGVHVLDPAAERALQDYAWPGNVRQLQNVILRMVISTDEQFLTAVHVRQALAFERDGIVEGREAATTATVLTMLSTNGGNISLTARRLGIARSTVRAHLRRAGRNAAT